MKPKESKGYLDLTSPTTVGSTAAVIAIGGLVAANTVPIIGIIGIPVAIGGAGLAAYELYRKMAEDEKKRGSAGSE
jgi:hypothetical protein